MSALRLSSTPPPIHGLLLSSPFSLHKGTKHRESIPTSIVLSLVASGVFVVSALPLMHKARSPPPQTQLKTVNKQGCQLLITTAYIALHIYSIYIF